MELLILLALFLVNGVFALSEMAVVSSRKARLQQWTAEGRPGAAAALALANEPAMFLSTIQVGITLIGITSGAFGEAALAGGLAAWLSRWEALQPYAQGLAVSLVVAGITLSSLILGELVPKRVALLNPEAIASRVAGPMRLLSRLAHPVVRALTWITEGMLRVMRLGGTNRPPITDEEIKLLMQQGAEAGVFAPHEQLLVARAFRIEHLRVGAIMTPRIDVAFLDLDAPPETNRRRIIEHGHSRFPVVRAGADHIEGVVLARSLLAAALAGEPFELARSLSQPLYVASGMPVLELIEQLRRARQTFAIVLDEHGSVDGVVTANDVIEALVGELALLDEEEEIDIVRRDDGSWLVDGGVTVERLKAVLGIREAMPREADGGYRTVAGFVMAQLDRIPAVGDAFEWGEWRWEVVDMDFRRVDKVLCCRRDGRKV